MRLDVLKKNGSNVSSFTEDLIDCIAPTASPIPSSQLIPKFVEIEEMMIDPIGSLRRCVSNTTNYFNAWVDLCRGDLKRLGKGTSNPYLITLINSQLCASLIQIFEIDFSSPFSFFLIKSRPWHVIREIASSDQFSVDAFSTQFKNAVASIDQKIENLTMNEPFEKIDGQSVYFSLPYDEYDMRFMALIIWSLNNSCIQDLIKHISKHVRILDRYYGFNSLLKQQDCVNKIISFVLILDKLPFDIDPFTACDASFLNRESAYPRPEFDDVKNLLTKLITQIDHTDMEEAERSYVQKLEQENERYQQEDT